MSVQPSLPALSPPSAMTTPSSSWKTAITPSTSYSPGGPTRGGMRIPSGQGLSLGLDLPSRIPVLVKPRALRHESQISLARSVSPTKFSDSSPSLTRPTTRPRSPSFADDNGGRKSPFHHRQRSLSIISRPGSPLRPSSPLRPEPEHNIHTQLATRPPRRMQLATKRSVTAPYIAPAPAGEIPTRRPSSHSHSSSPGAPSSFPKHLRRQTMTQTHRKRASSTSSRCLFNSLPGEERRPAALLRVRETAEGSLRGLLVRGQSSPVVLKSRPDVRRLRPAEDEGFVEQWLRQSEPPTPAVRHLQRVASFNEQASFFSSKYGTLARRIPSRAPSRTPSRTDDIPVLSIASPSPSTAELPSPPPFHRSVTAPVFRHASCSTPLAPLTTLAVQQTAVSSPGSPVCDTPKTMSRSDSPSPTFDARRAGFALRLKAGYVSFGDVGLECPLQADDYPDRGDEIDEAEEREGDEEEAGNAPRKWWKWTRP